MPVLSSLPDLKKYDISEWSDEDFINFTSIYTKNNDSLCINPKSNEQILDFMNDIDYLQTLKKRGLLKPTKYYFYFYINEEVIISIALINLFRNDMYELEKLCSHKTRYKYKDRSIGYYLLDELYSDFAKDNKVLLIRPAMDSLVYYYTRWKVPSVNLRPLGFLIYSHSFLRDNQIETLFFGHILFIKENILPADKEEVEHLFSSERPLEDVKKELIMIVERYEPHMKSQFVLNIRALEYVNLHQARDYIRQHISVHRCTTGCTVSGGKTKKYRTKSKRPKRFIKNRSKRA